jgi:osmotically inducible protein OsmC
MATRNGSAAWSGDLKGGEGRLTIGDGVFEGPYSFASRFEEGEGTNPEELIAAAHAACFSMALSGALGNDGHPPELIETTAELALRPVDGKPTIDSITLRTEGRVPGISAEDFQRYAEQAKADCPVSRALAGVNSVEVDARLSS